MPIENKKGMLNTGPRSSEIRLKTIILVRKMASAPQVDSLTRVYIKVSDKKLATGKMIR